MVVAQRPSIAARWQRAGEVGRVGEVGAVSGLRGPAGQAHGEHRFADPGWPDQQNIGGGVQVPVRCQVCDQGGVD
jgi:hypothetical protein